ncbi:hypothetical protein COOONC_03713 [Cooperia oncophora]
MARVVNSSFQLFPFKTLGYDKGRMRNEKNEELFPGVLNKVKATFWPPAYFPGMRTKQFFFWRSMKDHTEGIPKSFCPDLRPYTADTLYVAWIFSERLHNDLVQFSIVVSGRMACFSRENMCILRLHEGGLF